jgi:hypothetical protein
VKTEDGFQGMLDGRSHYSNVYANIFDFEGTSWM